MSDNTGRKIEIIFLLKAVAIILVVVGHYHPDSSPAYWSHVRDVVYTFHMPIFFMVSGYLFWGSLKRRSTDSVIQQIGVKAKRLGVPYLTISMLFLVVKLIAGYIFNLSNPVNWQSVSSLIINPLGSFLPLLWFIYSLFVIMVVVILVHEHIAPQLMFALSLAAAVMGPLDLNWFCIGPVLRNLPFFTLGYLIASKNDLTEMIAACRKYVVASVACYCLLYFVADRIEHVWIVNAISFVLGVLGAASVAFGISYIDGVTDLRWLKAVGVYSMSIYLFHTLFESGVRVVWYQAFNLEAFFELGAVLAIFTGTFFPLLLERYVIRKVAWVRSLLLGV